MHLQFRKIYTKGIYIRSFLRCSLRLKFEVSNLINIVRKFFLIFKLPSSDLVFKNLSLSCMGLLSSSQEVFHSLVLTVTSATNGIVANTNDVKVLNKLVLFDQPALLCCFYSQIEVTSEFTIQLWQVHLLFRFRQRQFSHELIIIIIFELI